MLARYQENRVYRPQLPGQPHIPGINDPTTKLD